MNTEIERLQKLCIIAYDENYHREQEYEKLWDMYKLALDKVISQEREIEYLMTCLDTRNGLVNEISYGDSGNFLGTTSPNAFHSHECNEGTFPDNEIK